MPETRPNILLITSDQQHWNTLGCLNPEIQTPHLDTLAQQGTLFNKGILPKSDLYTDARIYYYWEVSESARCLVPWHETL